MLPKKILMKTIPFGLILLVSLLLHTPLGAQGGKSVGQLNNRQQKQYDQIRSDNNRGALSEALEGLNKLLADAPDFTEGFHLRASIQYDQGAYEAAETDFQKVLQLDAGYDPIVLYQLALTRKGMMKYREAATSLEQFLSIGYKREAIVERAKKHLEDARFAAEAILKPVPFQPENIGPPISSDMAEYLPVLSADGQSMVFTRRLGDQEDFFVAEKVDGQWSKVTPLAALNSPFNEGAQSISADGRLMVFTFCQSGPDQGGCDLFYAEKCGDEWSKPKRIEGGVNSAAWEAQPSLSADGSLLLYASNRPGGQGGNDIWASRRSRSGKWGNPVNLGPAINTPGNDQSPFLHADGRTLYLSSDGRPGMGDIDLYFVRLQEDGQWGQVINLGYPVNTPSHEGALTVSLDGQTAYFAKSSGAVQDLDIFTFPLYEAARPLPVTYVSGTVYDAKSKAPLSATAELIDLDANRPVAIVPTCEDGSYLVCLPAGKNYALNISKQGYLFFSENFALSQGELGEPYALDAPLQPIEAVATTSPETGVAENQPIILKNVFFASGSAELLVASTNELDRLYQLLADNNSLRIQINGHTDHVGSDEDNRRLSEARAKAVYDYLIEKGIDAGRLRYKGYGESLPIADNEIETGRQQNRRTEFVVW